MMFLYSAWIPSIFFFFFFNDTATTEIYTLSLHDALPICSSGSARDWRARSSPSCWISTPASMATPRRSEEHTSELQSPCNLVCRLLLEKKKQQQIPQRSLPPYNSHPALQCTINRHQSTHT